MTLTIAIPTYNRAECLRAQLSSLVQQTRSIEGVKILVCDNCSTDDTEVIVEQCIKEFSNISYFKNERNLGLDGNVLRCYELATSDYIWYLSDDDVLLPGALEVVLENIHKFEPAVASFSFFNEGDQHSVLLNQEIEYHLYEQFSDRFANDFFKIVMISTLVVKKNSKIDLIELKGLAPTTFPQLTLALKLMEFEFKYLASNKRIVIRRPGYHTKNFFKLYCIQPRLAIRNANQLSDVEVGLLRKTRENLRAFVYLSILERQGHYSSSVPIESKDLVAAWGEYNFSLAALFYISLIGITRITPLILLRIVLFCRFMLKTRSVARSQLELELISRKHVDPVRQSDV